MSKLQSNGSANSAARCGIILSGGNGERLRDVVYRRRADYLPKQYLNFIGTRSMLEHTLHRAETLMPAQKLLVVIAKEHLQFEDVRRQLAARPIKSVVVQPANKDTAPGLLLPLMHLYKRYRDAVVAVFPSDHFILEEKLFMRYVDGGFRIVESDGSRIVLLGMEPHEPDPDYGYIVPGERIKHPGLDAGRTVEMFVEKPSTEAAKKIIRTGALWNTLVLVARCNTLLQAIARAAPELYHAFEPIETAIGTADEQRVIEEVYEKLPKLNFSKNILEVLSLQYRQALVVLSVPGVTWSDWGTSNRLLNDLMRFDKPGSLR
jgi:mannose-1-phosphate guanylyltransferase